MDGDCVNVDYWTRLEDGRIECRLCPRFCRMRAGQRGLCFVRRAREDGEGMELTGYGRSTGFCVDPIEKKPLNHFLPGLVGSVVRNRRLQPRLRLLPELGHFEEPRGPAPELRRDAGDDRPRRRAAWLRERRLYLQRSGHLHGIRARHGGRVPGERDQERRGDRGLRLRRAAQAPLRRHGRGQRRPQGLHRALLREALRRPSEAGAGDAEISRSRDRRVDRDHDACSSPARTIPTRRSKR